MWVLAIASGYPAAAADQAQLPSCLWTPYAGRPMLVLVDVTATGNGTSFGAAQVLRVGLGNVTATHPLGHALTVRTKAVGRKTYAYVGDATGRVMVFNVTGSNLLPLPPSPYVSAQGATFLQPVIEIELPKDPYDGFRANCTDMEIVGDYLYCALARIGVAIVDISNPVSPQLVDVMDTPGLALGLSLRSVQTGTGTATQLVVGDTRCGVRIYE